MFFSAGDTSTPSIDDLVQLYVTGIPDEMSDVRNYYNRSLPMLRSLKG